MTQATAAKTGTRVKETREELRDRLAAAGEDLAPPAERAAREGRAPRTRAQILAVLDPSEWACRGQEHSWPQLKPNATGLPAGMQVSAAPGGGVLFTEDCQHHCGRYRETISGPRGFYDSGAKRRYGTRPGYRHTVIHRDEALTKAELREGVYDTNSELLAREVKAATARAKVAEKEAKAAEKEAKAAEKEARAAARAAKS